MIQCTKWSKQKGLSSKTYSTSRNIPMKDSNTVSEGCNQSSSSHAVNQSCACFRREDCVMSVIISHWYAHTGSARVLWLHTVSLHGSKLEPLRDLQTIIICALLNNMLNTFACFSLCLWHLVGELCLFSVTTFNTIYSEFNHCVSSKTLISICTFWSDLKVRLVSTLIRRSPQKWQREILSLYTLVLLKYKATPWSSGHLDPKTRT